MTYIDRIRDLLSEQTHGKFVPEAEHVDCGCNVEGKGPTDLGNDPELVSIICPTSNDRQRFHPFLYRCFCRQTHQPCEMIVVDVGVGSTARSKFFTSGAAVIDPRVTYRFFDVEAIDKLWSIGTKRNVACYLARGDVIMHFDDDDVYDAEYVEWMMQALRWGSVTCDTKVTLHREGDVSSSAGLKWASFVAGAATLSRWWTFDLPSSAFFFCDPESEENLSARRSWIFGYGFSYAYLRDLWCMHPFQDVSLGEDFMFVEALLESGWQVAVIRDTVGFCAHTVHQGNISGRENSLVYESVPPQWLVESSRLLTVWVSSRSLDEFRVDRCIHETILLKNEIISIFATEAFQKEIRDAAQLARTPQKKDGAIKMVGVKYQSLILPKYGFEGSIRGLSLAWRAWPDWVAQDPEVAMKDAFMHWLISPHLQEEKPLQEWVPGLRDKIEKEDSLEVTITKAMRQSEELGKSCRGPVKRLLSPVTFASQTGDFNALRQRSGENAKQSVAAALQYVGLMPNNMYNILRGHPQ